jgi:nucleoside-diphosphate-sugar epimerase
MKTVLVTGATGFIGRHALDPLVARGFHVHGLSSRHGLRECSHVTWHVADLFDPEATRALVATVKPSHLLHFAWSMVPGGAALAPGQFRWVQATLDLLRTFAEVGGTRAVVAGSCAEYDWRYGYCVENLTPLVPRSYYGICKHATRLVSEGYFDERQLSLAWARIFFIYGPHEPLPRFVPSIVSSLSRGAFARCTHGEQRRDYLHVEDVADACVALLDTDVRGPVNVGSGQPLKLRDMAEYVARRMHAEERLQMGVIPVPPDEAPLLVADVRRLTTEVRWQPRYTAHAGLDHTIEWWSRQPRNTPAVECLS